VIPPVGMNLRSGKGADKARNAEIPPKVSAGSHLTKSIQNSIALIISEGVATPGKYGISSSWATSKKES